MTTDAKSVKQEQLAIGELAQKMTYEDIVRDFLLAYENYTEWKARVDTDRKVISTKIEKDHEREEDIQVEERDHEDSGQKLRQLSMPVGDYSLIRSDRIRTSFNKNHIQQSVALRLHNARRRVQEVEAEHGAASQEYAVAHAELRTLEAVQEDLRAAVSYDRYVKADIKYTGGSKE